MFFRVRDPGVPVEQIELSEPVLHVSWEPAGDRLVILHGEPRSPSMSFYSMSGSKPTAVVAGKGTAASARHELTHLFTRTGNQYNDVMWSPAGGVVALAMFAPGDTCMFDLLDIETNTVMASRRHDRCNRLLWDPSGRYLASCTTTELRNINAKGHVEDGFNIYTFQGGLACQVKREKLFQFSWRPRPKELVTSEMKKKVMKKLPHYIKIFDNDDKKRKTELMREVEAVRLKQAEEFFGWLHRNRAAVGPLKARRVAQRGGYDSDDDKNYKIEVTVEETVLSSRDQIIQ